MEDSSGQDHMQLVEKLTTGFGAMLEQVEELARRNHSLQEQLDRVRDRIQGEPQAPSQPPSPSEYRPPSSPIDGKTARLHRQPSTSTASEQQAIEFMGATGQDNAMAIADGVKAWKTLTDGKGPLWRRFKEEIGRHEPLGPKFQPLELEKHTTEHKPLPQDHPAIDQTDPEMLKCPFESMAQFEDREDEKDPSSIIQRPDSLPTPPPANDSLRSSILSRPQDTVISPPLSNAGSASKCPIRMLDERSPEEIAEYFETHKHEIPRSHEICVKRYQTNAEGIRQLDAKYGNLVNMIQGLGMKHQPLLPTKEDEQTFAEIDAKSARKVESWADNIKESSREETAESQDMHSSLVTESDRLGHFDRPLKEVRVGESPSRPWGISVPGLGAAKNSDKEDAAPTPKAAGAGSAFVLPEIGTKPAAKDAGERVIDEQARMVFTGPVFIGYSAEQAASLIQKCGWDPNGPGTPNA